MEMKGKVIVVTGGASGIGAALVRRFAHEGAAGIVVADLDAAHWMGRHTLALALIGYGVGRLNQTLMRDRAATHFVLIVAATAIHQIWTLSFELGGISSWLFLLGRVGLAAAATGPLGTVLLALVRRVSGRPIFGDVSFATDSAK